MRRRGRLLPIVVNVLRAKFLVDAESITQITGQPFKVSTLEREIRSRVEG